MDVHHVKSPAESSKADALRAALDSALVLQPKPARTHIYIRDIVPSRNKNGPAWMARLDMVSQTLAARERDKEKEREKEKSRRFRAEEELHQHEVIAELHQREDKVIEDLYQDEEFLVLYLENDYEPDFKTIEKDYDFDAVHVLASGALLLEQKLLEPDLQMLMAVRQALAGNDDYSAEPESSIPPSHKLEPEPRPQREDDEEPEPE